MVGCGRRQRRESLGHQQLHLAAAVHACRIGRLWLQAAPIQYHLRGGLTMEEARYLRAQVTNERILLAQLRRLPDGRERDMLEELHMQVRLQIVAGRQREVLSHQIDPRCDRVAPGAFHRRKLSEFQPHAPAHQFRLAAVGCRRPPRHRTLRALRRLARLRDQRAWFALPRGQHPIPEEHPSLAARRCSRRTGVFFRIKCLVRPRENGVPDTH